VKDENVQRVILQGQDIRGTLKQGVTVTDPTTGKRVTGSTFHLFQLPNGDPTLTALLIQHVPDVETTTVSDSDGETTTVSDTTVWLDLLFALVLAMPVFIVLFLLACSLLQRQQNPFSPGKKAKIMRKDTSATTFADVAGVDEAKDDLVEMVELLKRPQQLQRLGGKLPRGILLVGPPGTGKTLLARAVAGEAGVPFFSMSGSAFVEVLAGLGASRVRNLFTQAKKAAPSIIFIDEIDAVGRQRRTSITSNEEREQTLNQLLVEMDGFAARQAVVVLAATNRPDGLDSALLRPGRFDRCVTVDRPDGNGRLAILKVHLRTIPLAEDVEVSVLARVTAGMVGADLANLVNEAALLAARRDLNAVSQECFSQALDKIRLGAERPLVLGEEDVNVIAYHEGGHALTGLLTKGVTPVTKVTIIPRGQTLGITEYTALDDHYHHSKEDLEAQLVTALGGRAAEQVAIGRITIGAGNDLQRVTAIARQMVTRWGMSERLGTISYRDREDPFASPLQANRPREYSECTAVLIDEEVQRIVNRAHQRALCLLTEHRETLDRIATDLRLHETIDAKQLQAILVETEASAATSASSR